MPNLPITPGPDPFERILTGDFQCRADFRSNRPGGTPDWLIIQTTRGEGTLVIDGVKHHLAPGEIVLSRPNSPHFYETSSRVGKWDLLWAHFHPRSDWLIWLQWPRLGGGWSKLPLDSKLEKQIQHRLRQMHLYASHPQGVGRHDLLAMNVLEEVLLWCDAANESHSPRIDRATQVVLDTISDQYAEKLSLRLLAQKSRQSVARLTRQFREQVGSSPQKVIEERRLDRARQLLARTTLSVKEIAVQIGFSNPFYFSIRFKASTGVSPRLYREKRAQKV